VHGVVVDVDERRANDHLLVLKIRKPLNYFQVSNPFKNKKFIVRNVPIRKLVT
jgi:hypothetical protein